VTIDADTRFGNYHTLSPLGAGGMGEVYLARPHNTLESRGRPQTAACLVCQ